MNKTVLISVLAMFSTLAFACGPGTHTATRSANDPGDIPSVSPERQERINRGKDIARADPYEVFVGTSPTGPWNRIGDGAGAQEFTIGTAIDSPQIYVRIVDKTAEVMEEMDPGADIDAVFIRSSDEAQTIRWAEKEHDYLVGAEGITPQNLDPQDSLGAPDSYFAYPDMKECSIEGFVSLGYGGELVVELAGPIAAGDAIVVLEVAGCVAE